MTFHEAGLQILERAGQPLSSQEITARAIQEGLLSHVGQIPEQTMRERMAALARRSRNRRVVVVGPDRFALTDWGLAEDPAALEKLEVPEIVDEGPPRRSRERHPATVPSRGGRTEGKETFGRHRRKRLPPLTEVVFDILSESHKALALDEILARARERDLVGEDLPVDSLSNAIAEENRKRAEAGRRPAFAFTEAGAIEIVEAPSAPVSDERRGGAPRWQQQTLDSRRNAAKLLRRRLAELDGAGLERVAAALLEKSGYRDLRPVRRAVAPEGALLIARRKLGLCDYRFAVRLAPAGAEVTREDVQQLRRDLAAQGAHAGLVLGPAEAGREAKAEAQAVGQPLVTLLCADALADELVLRQIGSHVVEVSQVDEGFWKSLRRSQPLPIPLVLPVAVEAAPPAPEPMPVSEAAPGPEGPSPAAASEAPEGQSEPE
ncbi:MAG: HTH domain-containing protein [Myxococcales bacterium]